MTEEIEVVERVESRFEAELLDVGRNDGPRLFWEWWYLGRIPESELRRLLPRVWSMAEFPTSALGVRTWVQLFKSAGFVTDVWVEPPSQPWTIYRGHDAAHMRGMAWTTDIKKARWFADRFKEIRPPTFVYVATVPPHAVLGSIAGRNENEVIVNPSCLRGRVTPRVLEARRGMGAI